MKSIQSSTTKNSMQEFLSGGGEMGQLIREYDWAATPLGAADTWPQSLRTCVRIMLTSRQPIWIGWGKDLVKLYNDPYKAIVGGKHPWALGAAASTVWKDIWRDIEPMLRQVMEDDEGTYVESQLLIMERYGYPEETYYTFSYTPIPGDDGGTAGMICANTDDTDRIISERQLRTLTQLGKRLTDARLQKEIIGFTIETLKENPHDFPFALFYTAAGGNALRSDETGADDTLQQMPRELDLSNNNDELAALMNTAASTRKIQVLEDLQQKIGIMPKGAWQIAPDKAIILPISQAGSREPYGFLVVGLNPYRLFNESYNSFFSLISDQLATSFSNVYALEEERKRAEALAAIDLAKTTFFSNISHEFRTPLTLLLGPVEDVLNDEHTLPHNRARMDVAYRNVLRLQKLVNNLLDFSRIEAGRAEGSFRRVDICQLTEDLTSTFRSALEKAGMDLHFHCTPVTDPVYVDTDMWEKIMLNLLSNAFKYSHDGAVTINVRQEGNKVLVSVQDTGVGIPEDQLDKIFSRFHRVEHTEGRSQEGTGIGLALVKELVRLHHGTISVSSQLGKGSIFTIAVPTGKDHLPADKIAESSTYDNTYRQAAAFVEESMKWLPENNNSQNKTIQPRDATKPLILLADDNADMRDYVQRILEEQFSVVTAVNGEEAYAKTLQLQPDLLLSDIMMPRLDGFGLLDKVRSHPEVKNTPVIFLSARAGDEAKVQGLEAGADDYIVKPFSAKELMGRVSNHIRINQVRRETEQQFYQLFLQAPALINVFKGPEHRYEFFHPRNRELFGDADFTGLTLRDALPELEGQGVIELMDDVYLNGKTIKQNERLVQLRNNDGQSSDHYFNTIYQPWFDIRGQVQGVLNFAIDVTETVESRKRVEESEKRFRNLVMQSPVSIAVLMGREMVIDIANDTYLQLVGKKREEFVGRTIWEGLPEARQGFEALLLDVFDNGNPYIGNEHELTVVKDGQKRDIYVNFIYSPLKDVEGNTIGIMVVASEVTANVLLRKGLEQNEERLEQLVHQRTHDLLTSNEALERSNEQLEQYAFITSHDLQEPLRKIQTFANIVRDLNQDLLDERSLQYLNKLNLASRRMSGLINDLLDFSRLTKEEHFVPIDLNQIVDNVAGDFELLISQKDAEIIRDPLPVIDGIPPQINQLFSNLLSNALKFTSDRKPLIRIRAALLTETQKQALPGLQQAQPYWELLFEDNGIGFDPIYSKKIFDVFQRLNNRKYEGTGIGLALCNRIATNHHGLIFADSEEGSGARFHIILPARK